MRITGRQAWTRATTFGQTPAAHRSPAPRNQPAMTRPQPAFRRAATASLATVGLALGLSGAAAAPLPLLANPIPLPEKPCGDRSPCREAARWPAGTDAAGRVLTVVRLALDTRDSGDADPPGADHGDCVPTEYWLQAGPFARKLLALCNDGYGAAGMGEDAVTVGKNRFTHTQHGGSSWRWSTAEVFTLSPLRRVHEENDGSWTNGPNEARCRFDRTHWRGDCTWWAPRCQDNGEPPDPESAGAGGTHRYAYAVVPRVEVPAEWAADGWRTVGPGTCAGTATHALSGPAPQAGDDERLKVLAQGQIVFVDMALPDSIRTDIPDHSVPTSAAAADLRPHLALWLGADSDYSSHCLDPASAVGPWRFGLDGDWVLPPKAAGAPALVFDKARTPTRPDGGRAHLRLRLTLPENVKGLTWVSHLPDGDGPAQRMATSALHTEDAHSVGRLRTFLAQDATCTVRNGRLDFVDQVPPLTPHPVLDLAIPEQATLPLVGAEAIKGLDWLAGRWAADDTEEVWLPSAGGLLLGLNRTLTGPESPADFEYLRIESTPEGVFYVASPGGKSPTRFKLVQRGASEAVFENPEHDFPSRIAYKRAGDKVTVRIDGRLAGSLRTRTWTWGRRPGP